MMLCDVYMAIIFVCRVASLTGSLSRLYLYCLCLPPRSTVFILPFTCAHYSSRSHTLHGASRSLLICGPKDAPEGHEDQEDPHR